MGEWVGGEGDIPKEPNSPLPELILACLSATPSHTLPSLPPGQPLPKPPPPSMTQLCYPGLKSLLILPLSLPGAWVLGRDWVVQWAHVCSSGALAPPSSWTVS